MASNVRRGTIPYKTTGVGEYVDEIYSLKGFFGEWAHMWRRGNLAHPLRWSDPRLMYSGLDTGGLPAMRLLEGPGVVVSLVRGPTGLEKNADRHQIRFYHRGSFTLDTELGRLETGPGDFVVIPRGLIYRETPGSEDSTVFVFETDAGPQLAETMWDSVGYASLFIDYSEMELPEPGATQPPSPNSEFEVRVCYDGAWHTMVYDFDPCADMVGWVGDPVVFKLNAWDVPAVATARGHLTPPSGAVLVGEGREFFFNVIGLPPTPTVSAPDGSVGAPAHLNDYDEVWLTHVLEPAPETEGHLWLLPRTLPHPGFKRPPRPGAAGPPPRALRINFDTRAPLWWTAAAREALFEDPIAAKYESFFGVPLRAAPEAVRRRYGA